MENKKFNREWVKTFAIIFLAVLLVLTFFSNTIMNMTLPEVSTEYIQYGSIKTQVRGSGTVTASDNYSVSVPTTREILKVAVTKGSEVQKGDVLFYLAEGESDELQAARDNYDALNYEYAKMLIDAANGDDFADKRLSIEQQKEDLEEVKAKLAAYSQTQTDVSAAKLAVREAEKAVSAKQKEIDELKSEQSALAYTPSEEEVLIGKNTDVTLDEYSEAVKRLEEADKKIRDTKATATEKKEALTLCEREYTKLQSAYEKAKSAYDEYKADTTSSEELEKSIESSEQKIEELEHSIKYKQQEFYNQTENKELERAYDDYVDAKAVYKRARTAYLNASEADKAEKKEEMRAAAEALDDAYDYYDSILTDEKNIAKDIEKAIEELELSLKYELKNNTALKDELAESLEREGVLETMLLTVEEKKAAAEKKNDELEAAKDASTAAEAAYDKAVEEQKTLTESLDTVKNGYKYVIYKKYDAQIDEKNTELDALNTDLEAKKEALSDLEAGSTDSEDSLREQIKTLERQILSSTQELEKSVEEAGTQSELQQLELDKKKKEIDKAKAEVDKLTEKYTSSEVLAPVSGVIDSVNVTAGQKTQPDASLCEITLAEQGFKLTMTVTAEQAAKLRMGQSAEITSYIPYGSEIKATLAAIKNDTANPGSRQKLLEFNIEGDVTSGQSLSIAVGDKNASYENTVPNTAIREDSDGKYILIVESQSTPISTRYKAKRVAVTVTASDDTRSAITGDFDSYSYVIATSSKPINSGEQVKLVEN